MSTENKKQYNVSFITNLHNVQHPFCALETALLQTSFIVLVKIERLKWQGV